MVLPKIFTPQFLPLCHNKWMVKYGAIAILDLLCFVFKLETQAIAKKKKDRRMSEDKTFCMVTGGSRGFGRSVAAAFAKGWQFKEGSEMVLIGRNSDELLKTKSLIEGLTKVLNVKIVINDLEKLETLDDCLAQALPADSKGFSNAILVNNAGSLGNIKAPMRSMTSAAEIQRYFALNLISVFSLTTRFLSHFNTSKNVIVNVSSLAAIQEMPYMSLYCTGKAARDMLHKCLACEETDTRVLNYAPGPMETDMSLDIQLNCGNEASRSFFKEMREKDTIIKPDLSAEKLIRILKEDKYKSGAHIDFYDIE